MQRYEKGDSCQKFLTKRQIALLVVVFIILLLGQLLLLSKNVDYDNNLTVVFSNNQMNNYIFMDHYYSIITKVAQLSTFDEQLEYEYLKDKKLLRCDYLQIRDYSEKNGIPTQGEHIPQLKQKIQNFKQDYFNQTKPHQNKQNFVQIHQIDCSNLKIYIKHKKMILLLLDQVFQHIYPLKIIIKKQRQLQLKEEIYFNFNINQKHTMNINKYLRARFSKLIWIVLQNEQISLSVDIFIGDKNELVQYYNSTKILEIQNQGSYKYYLQQNYKNYKLIVRGISNVQRLNNLLYILKFSKIDFSNVQQIGSIKNYQTLNSKLLLDKLNKLEIPPEVAYLGNRKQALIEIAKKLYNNELQYVTDNFEEYAISLLKIRNKLITKSINGVFRYSYLILQLDESKIGIICFRMPNGELAYEAATILLNIGVKQLFMIGAGGGINPNLVVGDYIQITKTQYNSELISINPNKIINLINFSIVQDGENITIDSPLEETQNWLFNNRNMDCVDIETFHILKALQESSSDVKYLPGIFISDVLTQKPLQDKIGIDNAYKAFSSFMQSSFIYLKL